MLPPSEWPLWLSFLVFAVAAVAVWFAGSRLAAYADASRERTGLGEALVGMILLGFVTSLPEVAVGVSGALIGDAPLVVNNMLGGLAMQVAILAIADAAIGRHALTAEVASPAVLLQGSLCILLLLVPVAGVLTGDVLWWGMALWSWLLTVAYSLSAWLVADSRGRPSWVVAGSNPGRVDRPGLGDEPSPAVEPGQARPQTHVAWKALAVAAIILIAGYYLTKTGEAIAETTGLGSSFFGAVVLAIATSLPEVSTVTAAARLGRYEMAISDIFGTNLIDAALIAVIDAVYAGAPVLNEVGRFSGVAALLGVAVTVVYVIGLIARRERTVARIGIDSGLVVGIYVLGVAGLYLLR